MPDKKEYKVNETEPATATADQPRTRTPFEQFRDAAITVAEAHKCRIDVTKPAEEADERIRLEITCPEKPADPGNAMGIALEVCSEAGLTHTVYNTFVAYDAVIAWLRPVQEKA